MPIISTVLPSYTPKWCIRINQHIPIVRMTAQAIIGEIIASVDNPAYRHIIGNGVEREEILCIRKYVLW